MKIGDKFWGSFADHEVAVAMAAKKVGLSKDELQLHPTDVRKSLRTRQSSHSGPTMS